MKGSSSSIGPRLCYAELPLDFAKKNGKKNWVAEATDYSWKAVHSKSGPEKK